MKRLNLNHLHKQLDEIREAQAGKGFIPVVTITVQDDGAIAIGHGTDAKLFNTMLDVEAHLVKTPGITSKTTLILDDLVLDFELYLTTEPLLYLDSDERRNFIAMVDAGDQLEVITHYIEMIETLLAEGFSFDDFDDPALNDLLESYERFSKEELVERYRDQKWFVPYDPNRR